MNNLLPRHDRGRMAIVVVTFMIVFSTGCRADIRTPQATSGSVIPSNTSTPVQSQDTSKLTPTNPSTPTYTAVFPFLLPTQTPTPEKLIPTIVPTFSDIQAEDFILNSHFENADCDLPCWWGVIPGETDLVTAIEKISALGLFVEDRFPRWASEKPDRQLISAGLSISKYSFGTNAEFYSEKNRIEVITVVAETSPDIWQVIFGDAFYLKAMKRFAIQNLLSTYGRPDQVLVYVLDVRDPVIADYFLQLYFPRNGILVEYYGRSKDKDNGLLLCPSTAFISLWLWGPEMDRSILDLRSHDVMTNEDVERRFLSFFLPIEAASGMNIDGFYKSFKAGPACLETPAELWGR